MVLDSTQETMRVTRNPSDHNAYFGRGAHTCSISNMMKSVTLIKLMYGCYMIQACAIFINSKNFIESNNCAKGR